MSIHLDATGAAEAVTTEAETIGPSGPFSYEALVGAAQKLTHAGIPVEQSTTFLRALAKRSDMIMSGDERAFLVAGVATPALCGLGLVAAVLPSMDALRRARRVLDQFGLRVASFDLAPAKSDKRLIWEAMDRGEIDVILVSPGRLASPRFRERLSRRPLAMITISQAQYMSPWAHRFSPTYRQVSSFIRTLAQTPKAVHIWSTDKLVHQDIQRNLGLTTPFHGTLASDKSLTPQLHGMIVRSDEERIPLMEEFIANHDCQGVIYVGSLKQLNDTKNWLEALGETPQVCRPGMDEFTLQRIRAGFEGGETRIVISQGPFLSTLERAPGIEFIIFNGQPDSVETLGQEIFAQESASPIACLCLSSEHDFFHHRFSIDKNYPDSVTLRHCFQGVKDAFGKSACVPPETLKVHVKVATPYPPEDIAQCLGVLHREGLIEYILDAETDQIMVKMTGECEQEGGFWHEYPLRKLEQISRLERTRDFLTSKGDLGRSLRESLKT